ncbi:MAG: dienelactone hydrolase family protein [Gammaproteobacteria bacterium]
MSEFRTQTQRRIWLIAVLLAVSFDLAWADDMRSRAVALAEHIELSLPPREGPHPLAVLMPGCLSWHPHHELWRTQLLEQGFAVLHVDSFTAAGITSRAAMQREVCTGRRLTGADRAGDLIAVLNVMIERPDIDGARVLAWGWSHGAFSLFETLMRLEAGIQPPNLDDLPPPATLSFEAVFLYYPYCGPGSLDGSDGYPSATSTLVFHGDRDVITNPRACRRRAQLLAAAGADIEFVSLAGAGHWFDNHQAPAAYDASAAARARARIDSLMHELNGGEDG